MGEFIFPVLNFRKFASPFEEQGTAPIKYGCYVEISDVPFGLQEHILPGVSDFEEDQSEETIKSWMLHHEKDLNDFIKAQHLFPD